MWPKRRPKSWQSLILLNSCLSTGCYSGLEDVDGDSCDSCHIIAVISGSNLVFQPILLGHWSSLNYEILSSFFHMAHAKPKWTSLYLQRELMKLDQCFPNLMIWLTEMFVNKIDSHASDEIQILYSGVKARNLYFYQVLWQVFLFDE